MPKASPKVKSGKIHSKRNKRNYWVVHLYQSMDEMNRIHFRDCTVPVVAGYLSSSDVTVGGTFLFTGECLKPQAIAHEVMHAMVTELQYRANHGTLHKVRGLTEELLVLDYESLFAALAEWVLDPNRHVQKNVTPQPK